MPEDAVLDAGFETPDTPVETVDTLPVETGAEEVPDSQPDDDDPEKPGKAEDQPIIQAGKLREDAKQTLREIRDKNPSLGKALYDALFRDQKIREALPGGFKELQSLRSQIETLGGDTGIQELQAEVNGFRQFDELFTAGKPEALDFMLETPEGQASFVKLAPIAFQKFSELSPEGYQNFMGQVFISDLNGERIPAIVEMLQFYIGAGNTEKAGELVQSLQKYINRINGFAAKPVPQAQPRTQETDTAKQELEQLRATTERGEWKRESAAQSKRVFDTEWNRQVNGRKLSDDQTASIRELFQLRLGKAIESHKDKLDRYFSARDKQGFMRYAATIDTSEIPKALKAAFNVILPAKPGPKVANGQAPPKTPLTPGKPQEGFKWTGRMPTATEIDVKHPFNIPANFSAGKAVLKTGQRVQWKR